jgi:hypothetical protein
MMYKYCIMYQMPCGTCKQVQVVVVGVGPYKHKKLIEDGVLVQVLVQVPVQVL